MKKSNKTIQKLLILIITIFLLPTYPQSCLSYYQYLDQTTSQCFSCAYNCLTCLNNNICALCSDEYYLNQSTNLCQKCPFGCKTCTSSSSCTTCNTGLYINQNSQCISCSSGVKSCSIAVVQSCHNGYFLLGGICAGCLDYCQKCEDFVTCEICQAGYYLSTNKQSCKPCFNNCQICTSASTCQSCVKGYTISGSTCVMYDCSSFPFCVTCTTECTSCQNGKYLKNGECVQGASILCEQAVGPSFTDCQVDDYGCPDYAVSQIDPFTSSPMGVCTPYSATQYQQYIYNYNTVSNCISLTCGSPYKQNIKIKTQKAFYQATYYLNIKLYKLSTHTIKISLHNLDNSLSSSFNTITKQISKQLSKFIQFQPSCSSCPYGQIVISGTLSFSGYQNIILQISDTTASFTIVQYILVFDICKIQNCQTCTTSVDCKQCIPQYYLQLVQCVIDCDAGFYKYNKLCLLTCPKQTYPIQSSYLCILCKQPCLTCQSETYCLSCIDNYYLENSKCVISCAPLEFFGNVTTKQCQPCPNPCSTCTPVNSTSVRCLSCQVGYWFNGDYCIYICPMGLYSAFSNNISQCSSCSSSCTSCYLSSSICQSCSTNYLLYQSTCTLTATCLSGYFININNTCTSCQFPCATCINKQSQCTSCTKGALYNKQCVILCPDGYFINYLVSNNITCDLCKNNCKTCLSENICFTCVNGFYLYNGMCKVTCPVDTYYQQSANNSCVVCVPPCKQCSSVSICLSCSTGYLDSGQCTLNCNISSFINTKFQCQKCPSPCIQCYNLNKCTKCLLPKILYNFTCISITQCDTLGKYTFYSINSLTNTQQYGQCRNCTYPCDKCSTSAILCTTCVIGYLYLNDLKTCVQKCPVSYYQSSDKVNCLKCNSNCYQCQNTSTTCISCASGRYLDQSNHTCVLTCPDLYYAQNQAKKCQPCKSPCKLCYNAYFCKSCLTGILYNKICISTCPQGTIYTSSTNECSQCTNNCLTCSVITSNCSTCISGYYFNPSNNTCTSTCADYFYPDSFTKTCQNCIPPCKKCTGSFQCKTCVNSYYLYKTSCYLQCPKKYYENTVSQQCSLCNTTICETCDNGQNNCVSCALGYYYDSLLQSGSNCVTNCSLGYYQQPTTRTCKQCSFPCTSCQNSTFCSSCQSNYKLYLNRCYSTCPMTYYYNSTTLKCQSCNMNCQICISLTQCTKCYSNYYVSPVFQCELTCPVGYYPGKQDITSYDYCLKCADNCNKCTDFNACLECKNNYYLFNGLCLDTCPILHYQNTLLYTCQLCPTNCIKCINSTYCTQCINSYLYQNLCYIQCPKQTYIFNEISCKPCAPPCKQCYSQFTCITCITNYFYYSQYCITQCPSDVWYYPHNASCSATCPYNKYQDKMYCYMTGCGGYMVEYQQYCLENCPSGYYVSKQDSCLSCQNNQQICGDLFVADFDIIRSDKLELNVYYSEQTQKVKQDAFIIQFKDEQDNIIYMNITQHQITQYSAKFIYSYTQLDFISISIQLPYIQSKQSSQSISLNKYQMKLYYYNNYQQGKQSILYTLSQYLPLLFIILIFILIIINMIIKTSYFLQLLDFVQLISACLYLQIQYPIYLEKYLQSLSKIIFTFMPKLISNKPYTFSSSKFIYYHSDTSITRTHLMTFLLFFLVFVAMMVIIGVSKWRYKDNQQSGNQKKQKEKKNNNNQQGSIKQQQQQIQHEINQQLQRQQLGQYKQQNKKQKQQQKPQIPTLLLKIKNRIKYRLLNDLFSIFTFPLLLFSFSSFQKTGNMMDILVSIIIIFLTLSFIIFITNLIIGASSMGQLQGLLSDYQPVSSRLGLMYTPFAYIRRFLASFVFCIFPQKPLATLTLLLIFTILILICLFFYQPFTNQYTDYVAIGLECGLIAVIILNVIIGLDVFSEESNRIVAVVVIIVITIEIIIGLIWLTYLTFIAIKKYRHNPDSQSQNQNQQCIKNNSNNQQNNHINHNDNDNQQSAHNFIKTQFNNINNKNIDNIYSQSHNSNKQQFKHWNQNQSEQQSSDNLNHNNSNNSNNNNNKIMQNKYNKPPQLLMKKNIKLEYQHYQQQQDEN